MVFPHINRDKKEWAFGVFYNIESSALAQGSSVVWDVGTPDGNRVGLPATADLSLFVGVTLESIPATDYGRVQTYGYCQYALVFQSQTTAIAAGNILLPQNGAAYLSGSTASDGKSGFVYAAEAVATVVTGAAALKKVFIRAL